MAAPALDRERTPFRGFLARKGFDPTYTVMPPQRSVGEMIASSEIDVSQSAVSASWSFLEKGEPPH